ncbi:MAG: methyltransferase, TIGR04325 family [Myxococcales bacterium]|nr:methyltransferase, TIGR04325 family [Myxococcales bacterium]
MRRRPPTRDHPCGAPPRGVALPLYASFAEARQATPTEVPAGAALEARPDDDPDYPAMFWLRDAIAQGGTVLELGGGDGGCYYRFRPRIPYPAGMRWVVADRPAALARGRALQQRRDAPHLAFTDDPAAVAADVVYSADRLAFDEVPPAERLAQLARAPRLVVLNRLPLVDRPTRVALLPVDGVAAPCWLFNRAELVAAMASRGYRLADDWLCPDRALRVPADPGYDLPAFAGLCFASTRV